MLSVWEKSREFYFQFVAGFDNEMLITTMLLWLIKLLSEKEITFKGQSKYKMQLIKHEQQTKEVT